MRVPQLKLCAFADPELASKFGLNMFDQSNGQLLWSKHVHHYGESESNFDMEDFLLAQITAVKKLNPHSRAFIYRSGQCALSYARWVTAIGPHDTYILIYL